MMKLNWTELNLTSLFLSIGFFRSKFFNLLIVNKIDDSKIRRGLNDKGSVKIGEHKGVRLNLSLQKMRMHSKFPRSSIALKTTSWKIYTRDLKFPFLNTPPVVLLCTWGGTLGQAQSQK